MTLSNAIVMSSQYGGRQQSKWMQYSKKKIYIQEWKVCKKKYLSWVWGVDRIEARCGQASPDVLALLVKSCEF